MEEQFSVQKLLVLRKLTRSISDHLRNQVRTYLTTLAPLLRPRTVLGDYIQSGTKEPVRGSDRAFADLQALYEAVAPQKPFNLSKEISAPIEILNSTPEITPLEYSYTAKSEQDSKTVTVTSPLKWVLTYSGFAPGRLRDLLADRNRSFERLKEFLVHYLVMQTVSSKQIGLTEIFRLLHFPLTAEHLPDFGQLPITCLASSVSTLRPPDHVIIESTEISGMNAFEEVVNLDDIVKMEDPLKVELVQIVRNHGEGLLPAS